MSARFLRTYPCQDACGTLTTDERVEGAPVYVCPGCDSAWIELDERTEPAPGIREPAASVGMPERASALTP